MFSALAFRVAPPSLLIAFACLCLMGTASAQRVSSESSTAADLGTGGRFIIQGTIIFPSGQRVDRPLKVRLDTPTRGELITMTDTNGRFSFYRLTPGQYTILIDGDENYEAVNERTNLIQAGRSMGTTEEVIPIQIRLKRKAADAIRPEVVHADLANVPKPAVDLYYNALKLAQDGKNKAAIDKLNEAIKVHPNFMLAFNELGVQYQKVNELEKADEALQSALNISPNAFAPLVNHGIVLVRLKKYAPAEADLRAALKENDKSAIAHYYLGRALAYLGKFDEAETELNTAITLGGEQMKEAHRYLGAIYHARGDTEKAIAQLETYLRIAPKADDADAVRQLIKQLKQK
ncbi:MAG TPA: tetratricopeptide repeat protein [Pyrinomonadaceae bacterium]|nr:tetratricopeptide repeat protein [Pyrinomonadaceae bacterium]